MSRLLIDIYNRLFRHFGPQDWWPADSPFEMIVGAILTQNTNWTNVEKAIANLRGHNALDVEAIDRMEPERLERLVRPSGYFRQKASRLQQFTRYLRDEHTGDIGCLLALPLAQLRRTLLDRPGIGPETADSIILYGAGLPSFVVDAYTQRVFSRVGIEGVGGCYEKTRAIFMENLPHDATLFNEFHALIVRLAKEHCRKQTPDCTRCPIITDCRHGSTAPAGA